MTVFAAGWLFFKGDTSDYELLKHQLADPDIKVNEHDEQFCYMYSFQRS